MKLRVTFDTGLANMRAITVIMVLASVAACSRGGVGSTPKVPSAHLPAWQEALSGEVHAMADGSAYIIGHGHVFFVAAGKMTEVVGLPSGINVDLAELSPLADGSALLVNSLVSPPSAYWLQETVAKPLMPAAVKDKNTPSAAAKNYKDIRAGFFFVQLNKLKADAANSDCETEKDDPSDYTNEPEYDQE